MIVNVVVIVGVVVMEDVKEKCISGLFIGVLEMFQDPHVDQDVEDEEVEKDNII